MYVTVITIIIVISLYNTLFKYFIQYICGKVVTILGLLLNLNGITCYKQNRVEVLLYIKRCLSSQSM